MNSSTPLNSTSSKVIADIETFIDVFEVRDSVELLDIALQQSNVNVNLQDNDGRTVLLKSLNIYRSDSFIMRLLNANADPNISDRYGETPLYSSVTRPTITIANELIKKGANINARTKLGNSALHQAVDYGNLEAVCLLLYYGADVNVLSKDDNATPFLKALSYRNVEISQVLIDYYDGCLDNILYYAIKYDSNLAVRLIEMGANVNYVSRKGVNILNLTLLKKDPILFKKIWERIDYSIILNNAEPFLIDYVNGCAFATNDWMDCLCIILNSCVAIELVQQCNNDPIFFELLFIRFRNRKVQLSDRLRIIYRALSLSMKVSISDINSAYNLFGLNEECEILIYNINYEDFKKLRYYEVRYLVLPLFLGIEDDLYSSVCKILAVPFGIEYVWPAGVDWLGYFNRSCYQKLFETLEKKPSRFRKKLRSIPKFPTLFELSRNQSRKFIREAYNVKKPYQFYDAVKCLKLPKYIQDVILFKTPIYF